MAAPGIHIVLIGCAEIIEACMPNHGGCKTIYMVLCTDV